MPLLKGYCRYIWILICLRVFGEKIKQTNYSFSNLDAVSFVLFPQASELSESYDMLQQRLQLSAVVI